MRLFCLFVIACFLYALPCSSTLLSPFPLEQDTNKENLVPSNVSQHSSFNNQVFIGALKEHNDNTENEENWQPITPSKKRKLEDVYDLEKKNALFP